MQRLNHFKPFSVRLIQLTILLVSITQSVSTSTLLAQIDSVPFTIPGDDSTPTITSFSKLIPAPVPAEFVSVKNGKFFIGNRRLKFWGVNLCFGGNFPDHDSADKIAPHFAKLGINAVRFHHMDGENAPNGLWKTLPNGDRAFDETQVDRLDYFLNRLHENGIYADINLHVSRRLTEGEGFPEYDDGGQWWAASNKWVTYYDPDVQRELKEFCRELLTHKNPYRKIRRVDDPGIAVVEMLNENFFSKRGTELLPKLPERFQKSFQSKWNQWLAKKYPSTDAMVTAWAKGHVALGQPLFTPSRWKNALDDWQLNLPENELNRVFHSSPPAALKQNQTVENFALRLEPTEISDQAHHQQLTHQNISLVAGQPYSFSFWVRADEEREFNFEISCAQGEWRSVGVFETGTAGPQWKQIKRVFFPSETIHEHGYIAFSIGMSATPIEFADVRIAPGSEMTQLPAEQTLSNRNIGVPEAGWPLASVRDLQQFLVDTEKSWIVEMRDYLRELGVKVPITASQENYHADGVLAETVDFIDLHNYWHHPIFPAGKDWSPTQYSVGHDPIEAGPLDSEWPTNSLLMRTGWRYHGMPFTLSEWNHAEPSDVNSGAVMMAAAIGAMQDWDGVFFFDYEAFNPDWFRDHYSGFFEFNGQPVKLATLSVASNIFLRGDLLPLTRRINGTFTQRVDGRLAFSGLLGVDPSASEPDTIEIPQSLNFATPDRSLVWNVEDKTQAHLQINTPRTQGAWGLIANQKFALAHFEFEVADVARNYATVVATAQDGKPLHLSRSILLLTSSGAENTGMKWRADRTSVGDQWGTGPTRVNLVPAKVRLKSDHANDFRVYALDGTGKRMTELPAAATDGWLEFSTARDAKTIWFEVSR